MKKENINIELMLVMILGVLFGMVLISLTSCKEKKPQKEIPTNLSKTTENYYQRVSEFTYEGCEYIKVGTGQNAWGSHKGNCKNPIHKK